MHLNNDKQIINLRNKFAIQYRQDDGIFFSIKGEFYAAAVNNEHLQIDKKKGALTAQSSNRYYENMPRGEEGKNKQIIFSRAV